jgi:hypothetical protein
MDEDERIALSLERGQNQRARHTKNLKEFMESKHERHISAKIRFHRKMSDTYEPEDSDKRSGPD